MAAADAKFRAALEHGADPATVASWIAEVEGERLASERAIIAARLKSLLATADLALRAEVYGEVLGLRMIYRAADNVLAVTASPWAKGCVGGAITTLCTRAARRTGAPAD